jgi:hypothetical protein
MLKFDFGLTSNLEIKEFDLGVKKKIPPEVLPTTAFLPQRKLF